MELIRFQNATQSAGIEFTSSLSAGSSWGDFNGDSLLDIYVSNHFAPVSLYVNQGDGTFVDRAAEVLPNLGRDTHGVGWSDFDNDGDQDILQFTGAQSGQGSEPNYFFINEGDRYTEQAASFGIDYPEARSRTPLWYDYDDDGLVDQIWSTPSRPDGLAPPTIFRQTESGFEETRSATGFNINSSQFSFLSDLSGDGRLDLIINRGNSGFTIFDTTTLPFTDISPDLLPTGISGNDAVAADFNGDLRSDLYVTRSGIASSEVVRDDANAVSARIKAQTDEQGLQFNSAGNVTFRIRSLVPANGIPFAEIFIGDSGLTLADFNTSSSQDVFTFTLSPTDPGVQGVAQHAAGGDRGLFIGYDATEQQWQVLLSSPNGDEYLTIIESTDSIDQLNAVGFDNNFPPLEDFLLINSPDGLQDQSNTSGINAVPNASDSVVAGDFDNDMDIDIYVATSGPAASRPNILYENQGDGTFVAAPDARGASGSLQGGRNTVTTADYNLDGFLDFFLTTAEWPPLLTEDGPDQLLRNEGNDNHWLQIDLEGTTSNRDGIGAQVFATAGGVTQLREQSNGSVHFFTQNQQRIHFGLAENQRVEELEIRWPSGITQIIEDIPADQLIRVVEPAESLSLGQPTYRVGAEEGVFLWQDEADGTYKLRTVGAGRRTQFKVELITSAPLLDLTPFALENNDQISLDEFGFSFDSTIIGLEDGLDFRVAPGAKTLISVTQDGVANSRQLFVGNDRAHLAPTGWILDPNDFPTLPSFTAGQDLGLFVGQGNSPETLEFRWNGDGQFHSSVLKAFTIDGAASYSPVGLDRGGAGKDVLTQFDNGVEISGTVGTAADGLNVTTNDASLIGFSYQQDGLFQSHQVNPFTPSLGLANAYELPIL